MKNTEHNTILEVRTGSRLYGTDTPTSDEDFIGVFLPAKPYILGFKTIKQKDLSVVSKLSNGKNAPDAIDKGHYEFRHFAKLAIDNNPNILETLFANGDDIVYSNKYGKAFLGMKKLFPWKGLYATFSGYANGQKHKMIIRGDKYFLLKQAVQHLSELDQSKLIIELISTKIFEINTDNKGNIRFLTIGDVNFMPTYTVGKVLTKLNERLAKVSNREELLLKYSYDTKAASHLVRLLYEGKELLETGTLQFPLRDAEFIKDIKLGKYKIEEVLEVAENLEQEMQNAREHSPLPSNPQSDAVEQGVMMILEDYLFSGERSNYRLPLKKIN